MTGSAACTVIRRMLTRCHPWGQIYPLARVWGPGATSVLCTCKKDAYEKPSAHGTLTVITLCVPFSYLVVFISSPQLSQICLADHVVAIPHRYRCGSSCCPYRIRSTGEMSWP